MPLEAPVITARWLLRSGIGMVVETPGGAASVREFERQDDEKTHSRAEGANQAGRLPRPGRVKGTANDGRGLWTEADPPVCVVADHSSAEHTCRPNRCQAETVESMDGSSRSEGRAMLCWRIWMTLRRGSLDQARTYSPLWPYRTNRPELREGEVHVWRSWLDLSLAELRELENLLSPDERARASRFVFERDRRRFIAARAALRSILAECAGIGPRQVAFYYTPSGKPGLAGDLERSELQFNLSHSGALALIAVVRRAALGVDVECLSRRVDYEGIAKRFFSERERRALESLDGSKRKRGFFDCWTRKEAFVKALGEGLSRPFSCFDVSLAPGEGACLLAVRGDPEATSRWSLRALEPAPGYTGAVAVECAIGRLVCAQW